MSFPTDEQVLGLIADYERDFGPTLPFEHAHRLLVLYDEICLLFDQYLPEEDRGEHHFLPDLRGEE